MKRIYALAFVVLIAGCSNEPSEVNWTEYASNDDYELGISIRDEVHQVIRAGNCRSLQSFFDYALSRRQMAVKRGYILKTDMTEYVDYHMRYVNFCYDDKGSLRDYGIKGEPYKP